jgi:hypothetical protein
VPDGDRAHGSQAPDPQARALNWPRSDFLRDDSGYTVCRCAAAHRAI